MKKAILKSEDVVEYSAGAVDERVDITKIDSKLKLIGVEVPSIRIGTRKELEKYCTSLISDSAMEECHLICVNSNCKVISESCVSIGDLGSVEVHIRKIAAIALLSNAYGIFLTHNHPGGSCFPSVEDLTATLEVQKAMKIFKIQVLDHMIVTPGSGCYSFAQHGDLVG